MRLSTITLYKSTMELLTWTYTTNQEFEHNFWFNLTDFILQTMLCQCWARSVKITKFPWPKDGIFCLERCMTVCIVSVNSSIWIWWMDNILLNALFCSLSINFSCSQFFTMNKISKTHNIFELLHFQTVKIYITKIWQECSRMHAFGSGSMWGDCYQDDSSTKFLYLVWSVVKSSILDNEWSINKTC